MSQFHTADKFCWAQHYLLSFESRKTSVRIFSETNEPLWTEISFWFTMSPLYLGFCFEESDHEHCPGLAVKNKKCSTNHPLKESFSKFFGEIDTNLGSSSYFRRRAVSKNMKCERSWWPMKKPANKQIWYAITQGLALCSLETLIDR